MSKITRIIITLIAFPRQSIEVAWFRPVWQRLEVVEYFLVCDRNVSINGFNACINWNEQYLPLNPEI